MNDNWTTHIKFSFFLLTLTIHVVLLHSLSKQKIIQRFSFVWISFDTLYFIGHIYVMYSDVFSSFNRLWGAVGSHCTAPSGPTPDSETVPRFFFWLKKDLYTCFDSGRHQSARRKPTQCVYGRTIDAHTHTHTHTHTHKTPHFVMFSCVSWLNSFWIQPVFLCQVAVTAASSFLPYQSVHSAPEPVLAGQRGAVLGFDSPFASF